MRSSETLMSRLRPRLAAMFELAHQHNEGARLELAGMLADIFLNEQDQLSLRESELVNELIDQLLRSVNHAPSLRALLVEKFADKIRMPRKIAASLVHGDIAMAGEILTKCQTLTDNDLVTVITTESADHAAAIAERASISEAVADALVVTGDLRVMQLVAENLGAKLNEKTVNALTEAARFTAALREPIMMRPEMTASAAARLYWWVSQDLRRYALKRFGFAAGQIDLSLAKTIEELLGYHELDKANDAIMLQVANWMQEREVVSLRILPQVLRLGHFRLFNMLLARLTNLDLSLIDVIIAETGGRGLAVICRALGVDKAGFVSFFLLSRAAREDDHVVHPRELSFALAAYDKLSVNLAYDLLRSWQKNPGFLLSKQASDLILEA
jgi:uncharacterized protein (DUF2336 family)